MYICVHVYEEGCYRLAIESLFQACDSSECLHILKIQNYHS